LRELLDQVQLLVDDAHAGGFGVAGAGEANRLALQDQLAFIVGEHAGEDLHQRALARAVFAADGVQLAGRDVDGHLGQSLHAGEGLGDASEGDDGGGHRGRGLV
jgi:hypothetical protein